MYAELIRLGPKSVIVIVGHLLIHERRRPSVRSALKELRIEHHIEKAEVKATFLLTDISSYMCDSVAEPSSYNAISKVKKSKDR